jgi:hypothetical protein
VCSEPRKLDRFWLEFSAVIPRLGGAESDEGLRCHQKHDFEITPDNLQHGRWCVAASALTTDRSVSDDH